MTYAPRFDNYVGFVSPPASCEYSAQQFYTVCDGKVCVIQSMTHFEGTLYGADLGDKESRLAHLEDGILALKEAQVDVVAQFGGYWSLCYAPTYAEARDLEKRLSDKFQLPVILNWTAIADGLQAFGAKRISVTTGYYRPAWTEASIAFLKSAGFEVLWSGDLVDQGLLPDQRAKEAIEEATRWDYPDDLVKRTCLEAGARALDCDAICQTGAGMRVTNVAAEVEPELGKPLVATDLAIFWAVMKEAGIRAKEGTGQLLASTRQEH